MDIPTEADWGDYYSDIETKYAHSRFGGKSIEEVLEYFGNAPLGASEDISAMPNIPFQFYMKAYLRYLQEGQMFGDDVRTDSQLSDGASAFLHLVLWKLKHTPDVILPIMSEIMPVAEFVAENQSLIDASINIYGLFPEKLQEIKQEYEKALETRRI